MEHDMKRRKRNAWEFYASFQTPPGRPKLVAVIVAVIAAVAVAAAVADDLGDDELPE
jgi:hypothetical protein